jgi:hypothetical protein
VRKANPPIDVLLNILSKFNLESKGYKRALVSGEITIQENFNGGLLSFPAMEASKLIKAWEVWANTLLQNLDYLEDWKIHVDQISLACAVIDCNSEISFLNDELNYPVSSFERNHLIPKLLHYHRTLNLPERKIIVEDAFLHNFLKEINELVEAFI